MSDCNSATCIAGMEHLQSQRVEVAKAIKEEEAERVKLEQDMALLQKRLVHIKESLQKKVSAARTNAHAGCMAHVALSACSFHWGWCHPWHTPVTALCITAPAHGAVSREDNDKVPAQVASFRGVAHRRA